ncbi:uncharacterized protein TNCV_4169851 [Trichonephila clavipes]|nr:uncharacterized protein TNCV_4169851 [Trichonephila clavipes]
MSRGRFELREWEYSGQCRIHKMFDPFGSISPVMLCPKLTLQKAWKKGIRWDEDIKCELRKEFLLWFHELTSLKDLEVPRYVQRDDNWSVSVRNRVNEIQKLSDLTSWRHVPGEKNPADLPSRGCKAKQFLSSRWWEGPKWMKDPFEFKHLADIVNNSYDEDETEKEKSKSPLIHINK